MHVYVINLFKNIIFLVNKLEATLLKIFDFIAKSLRKHKLRV